MSFAFFGELQLIQRVHCVITIHGIRYFAHFALFERCMVRIFIEMYSNSARVFSSAKVLTKEVGFYHLYFHTLINKRGKYTAFD